MCSVQQQHHHKGMKIKDLCAQHELVITYDVDDDYLQERNRVEMKEEDFNQPMSC